MQILGDYMCVSIIIAVNLYITWHCCLRFISHRGNWKSPSLDYSPIYNHISGFI